MIICRLSPTRLIEKGVEQSCEGGEINKASSNAAKNRKSSKSYTTPDRFLSETYATEEGEYAVFRTIALNLEAISQVEKYDGFMEYAQIWKRTQHESLNSTTTDGNPRMHPES
ncbi:hypothetical protein HDR70_06210 [bacterium]|nr:hypothetical protein [bacterium]